MGIRDFYDAVRTRWAVQATRDSVSAVDEQGLQVVLDQAQLRRKFERGEVKCKYCRQKVNGDTLYAFFRESGSVKAVCTRPECVASFVEWIEARQS